MKKSLLALVFSFCLYLVASAYTMTGVFSSEDGQIQLSANGQATVKIYETGQMLRGTYNIDANSLAKGGTYNIYFTLNGENYSGRIMWPMRGSLVIAFSGGVFEIDYDYTVRL